MTASILCNNVLIGGVFALLGAAFGAFCTYRFAIKIANVHAAHARDLAEINAFREACSRLRAAFTPALGFIDRDKRRGTTPGFVNDTPLDVFLHDALAGHSAAFEDFLPFVSAQDLEAYQKACEEYRQLAYAENMNGVVFGATARAMQINEADTRGVIAEKIHAVLRFSKP